MIQSMMRPLGGMGTAGLKVVSWRRGLDDTRTWLSGEHLVPFMPDPWFIYYLSSQEPGSALGWAQ